jgi:hypothetical protein
MIEIEVKMTGPVLDGRWKSVLPQIESDVLDDVADFALERVQFNLDGSLRDPTPYYETQVRVENRGVTDRSVNDRGVIYGAWLEGTGSRNKTTRFKGYASFRRAAQETDRRAEKIAEAAVARNLGKLGA